MIMRSVLLALGLLGLTSCGLVSPDSDTWRGGERFRPPDIYAAWWAEVESCTDRESPFERVRWYRKAGEYLEESCDGECVVFATASWAFDKILIASEQIHDKEIAQHEMAHLLMDTSSHPNPPFGTCVVTTILAALQDNKEQTDE